LRVEEFYDVNCRDISDLTSSAGAAKVPAFAARWRDSQLPEMVDSGFVEGPHTRGTSLGGVPRE